MKKFDPHDKSGMREIMAKYGDVDYPIFGENEKGEDVMFSIYHDRIVTETFEPKYIRKNVYYYNGDTEELYEARSL